MADNRFSEFAANARPRLERALIARFGIDPGLDAAAEALAYAWANRVRLEAMTNPVGYLYTVGCTTALRALRRDGRSANHVELDTPMAARDPQLLAALRQLRHEERTAVLLIHGYGWRYAEAAETLDITVTAVTNHVYRGLKQLRSLLGDDHAI